MSVRASDVARLAALSRSQVSNYFNNPDLVSERAKDRIRGAIEQLGYVPDESARQLRVGSSRMIGLLVTDAWAPFFADVCRAVENEAIRLGWHLQVANSARDSERETKHLEFFQARRVQGLIVVPQADTSPRLLSLADRGVSSLLLDPPHHHPVPVTIPSVAVDHELGAALAADHLHDRSRRRFAFVGDAGRQRHSADRLTGFRRRLAELGQGDQLRVVETEDLSLGAGTWAAGELFRLPKDERPDAVFAGNDLTALGVMHAFSSHGLQVPGDVSVVGYDDIDLADQFAVPLTTIRQPTAELGARAAGLVIDRIGADLDAVAPHEVLQPTLVVRCSS